MTAKKITKKENPRQYIYVAFSGDDPTYGEWLSSHMFTTKVAAIRDYEDNIGNRGGHGFFIEVVLPAEISENDTAIGKIPTFPV